MKDYRVVMVDDDKDVLDAFYANLQDEFTIETFTDPRRAINFVEEYAPDAVVLDYHMPGTKAFDLYSELRSKKNNRPIIFLTGDTCPELKVQGLDLGADDFLRKPISSKELSAHIKNRIKSYQVKNPEIVKVHNLQVNLESPEVVLDGNNVNLTKKEFQILSILIRNLNLVVKKHEMIQEIWPSVKVEDNNLDTHLSNLRRKLKGFGGKIITFKCFGYIMKN